MKRTLYAIILCFGVLLSSCAYVQTHKNVEELGSYFDGELLSKQSMALYKRGDQWYLSATKARFKLHYPVVHDSVFQKNDSSPEFRLIPGRNDSVVYHPISAYAAQILQRSDGYYQLRALSDEIHRTAGEWVEELPGAQRVPIAAEIGGKQSVFYMEEKRVPQNKPLWSKALGKVDFILIDVPASVVYNVAIPFMAPFVFFYEFSRDD